MLKVVDPETTWHRFMLVASGESPSPVLTAGYMAYLDKQFEYISRREQYANSINGAPSWVSWWSRTVSGKSHPWFTNEAIKSRSVLKDATGIAPLNLTMSRVLYLTYDAPEIVKRRFLLVTIAVMNSRKDNMPLPIAMQYGAIAALPSEVLSDEPYQDLWRRMRLDKYLKNGHGQSKWGRPVEVYFPMSMLSTGKEYHL